MNYKSDTSTKGRKMAGARSLWRANGMKEEDFGKPIIAIVNSFTQFVPGHVHLKEIGTLIKEEIYKAGGFGCEFNTIAIDDGIAMGHSGMLYSLPSRDLIADSVEYMVNAHCADALICIPNCDKIVPGMMMAAMRLNIPTIFVSGGPMEAGIYKDKKYDLIDVMKFGGDVNYPDKDLTELEKLACPTCGSCSGMFTANSMNCLTEVLGLGLPGNGTVLATHKMRKELYINSAKRIVDMTKEYYEKGNTKVLPLSIVTKQSVENSMVLDIAMGGSTNTVLHLLAVAREAKVDFTMSDIDRLSRVVPNICKVAPSNSYHIEDVNRAGGILSIMGELNKAGLLNKDCNTVSGKNINNVIVENDIMDKKCSDYAKKRSLSAPGGGRNLIAYSQDNYYKELDTDRKEGCIRTIENCYNKEGGLAVLFGNIAEKGCIVKTAGVDESIYNFKGKVKVFDSQDAASEAILSDKIVKGDIVVIRYEGPKGGPGMQEMLYPTTYLKSKKLDKDCALLTDGRFSGGTAGLSIGHASPEAANGGLIGLVNDGDIIEISIPKRSIELIVSKEELAKRKDVIMKSGGFKPKRERNISYALKLYSLFATSADMGAVRDMDKIDRILKSDH